ncbi:MAG: T9SS type A sorting domain-containing protein, partial [Phaeodactylibacter sp.]|nr:T9SS type A sorting domain-containing protein [Phaeodactylibacter sp.]
SNWVFTTVGPQGPYSVAVMNSTTAGNGWVIFDSDSNCNPAGVQEAWLISPPINAEDKDEVWMSFETIYASFNDSATVHVGTDLGNMGSWAKYDVFGGVTNNQYGDGSAVTSAPTNNPQQVLVNITDAAAGEAQFYFAFRFLSDLTTLDAGSLTGCAYSWQIDDIELNESSPLPPHDMRLSDYSIAPNAVYPLSQVEPIYYLGEIQNVGSTDQTNVNITMEVTAGGSPVFNTNINLGTVEPDSFAIGLLTDPFLPSSTGTYLATYNVVADSSDINTVNNTAAYSMIVNDSAFQKETEIANSPTLTGLYPQSPAEWADPSVPHQWGIGNLYYVPGGAGNYLRYVTFSIDGTAGNAGEILFITVYRWEDENGDFVMNASERDNDALVGATTYTIQGNEDPNFFVTTPFINIATGGSIELVEEGLYAVVVEHLTTVTDDSKQVVIGGSSARDYFPMVVTWFDFVQDPRWAAVVGVNDNANDGQLAGTDFETNLYSLVPVVRFSVGDELNVGTINLLDPANRTTVFPNPASDVTMLDMEFTEVMQQVEIRISDVQGRTYLAQQLENVQAQTIEFNVEHMPSGAYFFEIITEKGVRAENFIIQH